MRDIITEYKAGARDFRDANLGCADLGGADLRGANLRGANLRGANLGCADLRGADLGGADLRGANLRGANLRGANLGCADLGGADLRGANLRGANLRGADLGGVYLGSTYFCVQWIVQGGTRSDGYQFMLTNFIGEGVRVKAGCRNFTWDEAIAHWTTTRPIGSGALADETHLLLANLWDLSAIRGLSWENN